MKNVFVLLVYLLFSAIFPSLVQSEILWEKEFIPSKFIESTVPARIYESNDSYFLLYFGMDSSTAEIVNYKWKGSKYPALMKMDKNGNTIFQEEKVIPLIDTLAKAGVTSTTSVRGFRCTGDELLFDIPQGGGSDFIPNLYKFSTTDCNLKSIEGISEKHYLDAKTQKGIFTDNEFFVLAGALLFNKQSRIDVNNFIGDELNSTIKYQIILEMDEFRDSLFDDWTYADDFLFDNDKSFFVKFRGIDNNTIIAKYSYDKEAASKLHPGDTIRADLVWHTIYKSAASQGNFKQFTLLEDGNLLVHHGYGILSILDKNGKVIFNKQILDEKYQNYTMNNFIQLKYKPGYFAFWGDYNDNTNRNFAVLITDSVWNVVESFQWDYNGKRNLITDIKEKENGNLFVIGTSLYSEGTSSIYKTYLAEIHPDYVGVEEQKTSEQLTVSPVPATDFIHISNINYGENIEIYDLLGMKLYETKYTENINIKNIPQGIYFLKTGNRTTKFIKSK